MDRTTVFWRRIDVQGLERMELVAEVDGLTAASTVLSAGDGGYRLDHRWELDRDWHVRGVSVARWNDRGCESLSLERHGGGWRVNGEPRPDLDGAEEPDLSVTPFCNTLPIRRMLDTRRPSLTIDTAYIEASSMTVARSSQRYERQRPGRFRYIDLGLSKGFAADLVVDRIGLVMHYEHLFERVPTPSTRFAK